MTVTVNGTNYPATIQSNGNWTAEISSTTLSGSVPVQVTAVDPLGLPATVQKNVQFTPGVVIVTSTADSLALGTLPWAVQQANAVPGSATIDFNIPADLKNLALNGDATPDVFQISLASSLVLQNASGGITIDGTSEAAFLAGNPNSSGGPAIDLVGSGGGVSGMSAARELPRWHVYRR